MPNKETKHYSQYVDEKVALLIGEMIVRTLAAKMRQIESQAHNIEQRDPADPYLPVLKRKLETDNELFDRLEELMRGLAENKVRIVKEGALVHAVAERLALTANSHGGYEGGAQKGKEDYILVAQQFLAEQKRTEVIL